MEKAQRVAGRAVARLGACQHVIGWCGHRLRVRRRRQDRPEGRDEGHLTRSWTSSRRPTRFSPTRWNGPAGIADRDYDHDLVRARGVGDRDLHRVEMAERPHLVLVVQRAIDDRARPADLLGGRHDGTSPGRRFPAPACPSCGCMTAAACSRSPLHADNRRLAVAVDGGAVDAERVDRALHEESAELGARLLQLPPAPRHRLRHRGSRSRRSPRPGGSPAPPAGRARGWVSSTTVTILRISIRSSSWPGRA